ncbi:permease [Elizabethkingia meningoseptica]|uniref:Permease n=2 Tax=Elizabethkingia meningoseptica TaxID=238 RepID=A0A1T3IY90_ELIME|nr:MULTISPECIES: EamA family transporter [Elizabethkingia]AQX12629.1 permease [Elizabethkingia meningoseptica]MBG0514184.1 EamA family transporter [Elizabethkingia meningoseptica]MDE5433101.1 EamA family transporter [Elizabethkingia meningoseptica]MDE5448857.1 EamA family transporter [Elizabethkingia meningoseptica]MDE5471535.1 EamA family transporter [Elizabethkingia meningoseptica]
MKDYKLLFAIVTVALVWGTTFLGIRVAVESIPGWFVAGIRQLLAALIMGSILLSRRQLKWIGWKNLRYQLVFSTLMLIGANGLTTVAEENVTSSLASLISACAPILVFLGSLAIGLQKFSWRAITGILICFSGVIFIFWDGLKDLANPSYRNGIILMFFAISGWASGTIFTKKMNIQSGNISLNLFYQFAFAGIVQIMLAFIFSENYNFGNWTLRSISAMIYLAVFGSVTAFFAFHYALTKITPIQVSILAYINTIIAIFLGWLLLDEKISAKFIIAAVLIICGVFITNYKPKSERQPALKLYEENPESL